MNNGTLPEVIAQFDKISSLPDVWDHNQQYQKYLLKRIGEERNSALDIGCGTGEFTKKISAMFSKVTGVDVSKNMIDEARIRNTEANINFVHSDIEKYLTTNSDTYDLIISIATFHHLNAEAMFELVDRKLNKNGTFVVLDLYELKGAYEKSIEILAAICNPIMYFMKRGTLGDSEEEKRAWIDHEKYDQLETYKNIKKMAMRVFGECRMKHHLFWRYSLIYKKY